MSRLRKTNCQGIEGWQWDIGPIFVGEEGRTNAVSYGKVVQCLEEWKAYAKLCLEQAEAKSRLKKLQENS